MKLIPLGIKQAKKHKGLFAQVDDEDYDYLMKYSWHAKIDGKRIYVATNIAKVMVRMHRLLMDFPTGKVIDHIDRNPLNNQKANLRICTTKENAQNREHRLGRGVYKHKGKFIARLTIHLGTFETEELAIKAFKKGKIKYKSLNPLRYV